MEWRWYLDVSNCNPKALGEAVVHRDALVSKLFALKNLPDPAPDALVDLADSAARYAAAAADVSASAPNVAGTLASLVPAVSQALHTSDISAEIAGSRHIFRMTAPLPDAAPDTPPEGPQ
jgi:hypothetical protein